MPYKREVKPSTATEGKSKAFRLLPAAVELWVVGPDGTPVEDAIRKHREEADDQSCRWARLLDCRLPLGEPLLWPSSNALFWIASTHQHYFGHVRFQQIALTVPNVTGPEILVHEALNAEPIRLLNSLVEGQATWAMELTTHITQLVTASRSHVLSSAVTVEPPSGATSSAAPTASSRLRQDFVLVAQGDDLSSLPSHLCPPSAMPRLPQLWQQSSRKHLMVGEVKRESKLVLKGDVSQRSSSVRCVAT